MASGPSLNAADAERVKRWRTAGDDRRVIVTNTTFKMAPWADVLYAMDSAWWRKYHCEAAQAFKGDKFTVARGSAPGAVKLDFQHGQNSGAGAMALAEHFGARQIILLGYDCQYTGGRRHWHGDHPRGLGNCVSLPKFNGHFEKMARQLRHCHIINCSRETALKFWPRLDLEEALQLVSEPDFIPARAGRR
ncbi:hypothetical protein [Marinobacter sp. JSM 1782161]|uniref:hypothetical protein n=1 Tax=Marinobacter sp. JSM 1782161 TaxID=2685906 RepID=UPI001A9F62F1|nr:hypothetical protein [Marinobacter sp. JSM 1782161]